MSENQILNPAIDALLLNWLTSEELTRFKSACRTESQIQQYNGANIMFVAMMMAWNKSPYHRIPMFIFSFLEEDVQILLDTMDIIESRRNEENVDSLLNELGIPKQ